jgi:shikimate kinase
LETGVLRQLIQEGSADQVIATGGGIVLKEENWALMKKIGWVIGLTATPEVILERVGTGRGRPLLTGSKEDVAKRIEHLLQARAGAYAKADWTLATDKQTPETLAKAIKHWCAHQESKA